MLQAKQERHEKKLHMMALEARLNKLQLEEQRAQKRI
jgi:hypothetical protein